jgi:hypothetical protein
MLLVQHSSLNIKCYFEDSVQYLSILYITLYNNLLILYGSFRITSRINQRHQYHPESFSSRDDIGRGLIRNVIRKEPYHIMFIIYLNMRKSCSVLWTFSHVINIILRGMLFSTCCSHTATASRKCRRTAEESRTRYRVMISISVTADKHSRNVLSVLTVKK